MFKWVWRFLSQNSSLWANVIKSIHGDHGKIGKQVKVSYPSIWLDIVKEVDLLKKRGLNLLSFVNKKVGNGSDTLFWEETWHGDVAFKFLFPRAYALESCKNIDVASKLSQNSLAFTFRREPRGGVEQDQFDSLKAMVEGDFTAASIRKLIDEFTLSEVSSSTRWIKAVPIKVYLYLSVPAGRYVVPTGRVFATVSIKVPTGSCKAYLVGLSDLKTLTLSLCNLLAPC
ncbi:hypothetical protein Tco_0403227 [Tanacetum coccineum]